MIEQWDSLIHGEDDYHDVGGNNPLLLNEADYCFMVHTGKVNLFVVRIVDGQPAGRWTYLCERGEGEWLFGISHETVLQEGMSLLVTGGIGTRLLRMKKSKLKEAARYGGLTESVALVVDAWIETLSKGVIKGSPPKLIDKEVTSSGEVSMRGGEYCKSSGGVLWIKHHHGDSSFLGMEEADSVAGSGQLFPLSPGTWMQAKVDSTISAVNTSVLLQSDDEWAFLENFHRRILYIIRLHLAEDAADDEKRMRTRSAASRFRFSSALYRFFSLFGKDEEEAAAGEELDPLLAVFRAVAAPLGIVINVDSSHKKYYDPKNPVLSIAKASRIRTRRVALRDNWWCEDNGPLVAFMEEDKRPVALLPKSSKSYELYDPSMRTRTAVSTSVAARLHSFAYMLYRSLPSRSLTGKDLIGFGFKGRAPDLLMVILLGTAGGLLGILMPVVTGVVFDWVIPQAEINQLFMLCTALAMGGIGAAIFEFTRSIAILRLEGRMDQHVQNAVWDRLLELPLSFFRKYSSGDLADRAMGISNIRSALSDTTLRAVLSGLFSIFSLLLLFYYSLKLALTAVGITAFAVIVIAGGSYFQLRYRKELALINGKIEGMVLGFVTGISKFRVAGSERLVFAQWAAKFREEKIIAIKSRIVSNILHTFSEVFMLFSIMIIFYMIILLEKEAPFSVGHFLAFSAAFGQFLGSVLGLSGSVIDAVGILPYYQRCKPIFEAVPEADDTKAHPGYLKGEIEVSRLSFRYSKETPLILNDVSLHARAGEMVAIVGPSGSGKSTLLRIMLGFEKPEQGGVFFDGQELSGLDVRAVRQQIGVVLQNGKLMGGDIFTNIVGSSLLSIDDAWEAARMAGLDEDINAMPMGMYTVISLGSGTLSGGQRQRLLIARALAGKPRILFFDEATSALDNKTQAIVKSSMERLQTTRIVIAHRLSTIINADRIYVLEQGRIVQTGTYEGLLNQEGVFSELAKRQIA